MKSRLVGRTPLGRLPWLIVAGLAVLALAGGATLLQPGQGMAQAPVATPDGGDGWTGGLSATGSGSDWQPAATAVAATALVLALLYATLWGARHFLQGRGGALAGLVQLQSSVRLGPNQALHVVRFGSVLLLIGAAQSSLTVLAQLPAGAAGTDPTAPESFGPVLTEAMEHAVES